MTSIEEQNNAYLALQKASGLKIGDTVQVIGKVPTRHLGWDNGWTVNMDQTIGKEYVITHINGVYGIGLEGTEAQFPVYALKFIKSSDTKIVSFELQGYVANVLKDGNIEIPKTGLTITSTLFLQIVEAVKTVVSTKQPGYIPEKYSAKEKAKVLANVPLGYYLLSKGTVLDKNDQYVSTYDCTPHITNHPGLKVGEDYRVHCPYIRKK